MLEIVFATLPYFALIGCGYLARGARLMGEGSPRVLNDFVLFFALPALMVRTIGGIPIADVLRPGFLAVWGLVSVGLFLTTMLVSGGLLRLGGAVATIHAMAVAHGNVGYLGISLVLVLMGQAAAAPVAMAIIFDMLVIVPAAIALAEVFAPPGEAAGGARRSAWREAGRILRASALNPFVIAICVGLLMSVSGLAIPSAVDDFLEILGQAAVPAALFAIGVTLYGQPLRAAGAEIGALCAAKLLAHPVIVAVVATRPIFALTTEEIAAAILLAALPVANNVFVIATRYEVRAGRISSTIFATTFLALVSFNLWAWLLLGGE